MLVYIICNVKMIILYCIIVRARYTCYSPILSIEIVIPDRDVPYGGSEKYFAIFLLVLTFSAWVFSPWTAHAASGAQILLCSRRSFFVSFFLSLSLSSSLSLSPPSLYPPVVFSLILDTRDLPKETLLFFNKQTMRTNKCHEPLKTRYHCKAKYLFALFPLC